MVAPFKVGGLPAAPACALHKLRWGSDPLFTQENTEEDKPAADKGAEEAKNDQPPSPPKSGGMKRTLTKTHGLTLTNDEEERRKLGREGVLLRPKLLTMSSSSPHNDELTNYLSI